MIPILRDGLFILACVQTIPAVIDTIYGRSGSVALEDAGISWLVFLIVFAISRKRYPVSARPARALPAVIAAIGLAFLFSLLGDMRDALSFSYHEDTRLWTHIPGASFTEHNPRRGTHTYRINRCGFRGPIPTPPDVKTKTAVLIGNSYVFGAGLEEGQTVTQRLQARLEGHTPPIAIANGGLTGNSLVTFPDMLRHADSCYAPDLFVLFLKREDIDDVDFTTRKNLFHSNPLYRLFVSTHLELIYEMFRFSVESQRMPDPEMQKRILGWMDEIVQIVGERRLLVVTTLDADLNTLFSGWFAKHPAVGWYNASVSQKWMGAKVIPGDYHWSAEGADSIAALLEKPVSEMLALGDTFGYRGPEAEVPTEQNPPTRSAPKLDFMRQDGLDIQYADGLARLTLQAGSPHPVVLKAYWKDSGKCYQQVGAICFVIAPGEGPPSEAEAQIRALLDAHRKQLEALAPGRK